MCECPFSDDLVTMEVYANNDLENANNVHSETEMNFKISKVFKTQNVISKKLTI